MMKVASFDIVFQEIPGEVTLALNLSNCPCHCPGCHSPHLAEDIGEIVNEELLNGLLARYGTMITCVAFMGGDANPAEVAQWARYVKACHQPLPEGTGGLRTAWYSGRTTMPQDEKAFDYVKLGPYIEALGGLKSEKTNQHLYKRTGEGWEDITSSFWRKQL
ncbi:MAG: anaerobic ribonucleoside-triphosphate reductase activating protein [Paludibacteraceae bacterium]|nr:anaerobic ribonucleoside-triphosphate reductase activating protein [Paludibacteraceae bacterium]